MNLETWKVGFKPHYLAVFFLAALAAVALLALDDGGIPEEQKSGNMEEKTIRNEHNGSVSRCNWFSGRWVFDNVSYPLYEEGRCSFMLEEFACQKYGRRDLKYQNWRWQPHGCDLPRFNGTALLERIRGKKLVFVGDSLNRNQWISMLCLIESSLPKSTPKSVIRNGNMFTFHATEHNASIGFYWSPLLVESNCDDPYTHKVKERVVRIAAIEKHGRHWTDADILIFDAFMWWLEPSMRVLWGSFGSADAIYKRVEMTLRLYEMALNTWSDWLEININRSRTQLFFMSLSPFHVHGQSWEELHNCYNETEPILREGYSGVETYPEMGSMVEAAIQKLETRGLRVEYLNITKLSDYRKDAHPSVYRKFYHSQVANPSSYSDCMHWCLPGVPDVWNQILYSYIINSTYYY